jgi:hypothetical protein
MIDKLVMTLSIPLLLIIMVAVYTQFETNVDRAGWTADANTTFTKVNTGTYNGFKLGSLLPYVVIAMLVLGLIIGSFAIRT